MPTFAQSLSHAAARFKKAPALAGTDHSPHVPLPDQTPMRMGAGAWLAAYALLLCALAVALPVVTLPPNYHDFADHIAWGVLPHARDVLSNAAFAVAGVALLWAMRRVQTVRATALSLDTELALRVSAWGLILTTFASGIYHLQPNAAGLALDRAGMLVAFAGMLGVLVVDYLPQQRVVPVMAGSLLLGAACVLADWLHGNMTPWVLFQGGAAGLMLLLPICMCVLADKQGAATAQSPTLGISWWQVLALYAVAKALEMADHPIWQWSGELASGHNLKHVAAAATVLPVMWALRRVRQGARTDTSVRM
ncbi:MAG: hypothetical protein Q4G39_03630 [Brachymonas sp.]|nr:hypothetical protein [Brachymonas sp.]